jgi:hypothetical protein
MKNWQPTTVAPVMAAVQDDRVIGGQRALTAVGGVAMAWWLLATGCEPPSSVDPGNVTPAGTESCALIERTAAGSKTLFCVDTLGLTVNQAMAAQVPCEAEPRDAGPWTFAYDACPREGALGGCRLTTDISQQIQTTQWYYEGGLYLHSAADDAGAVMEPCLSNYTFIAP